MFDRPPVKSVMEAYQEAWIVGLAVAGAIAGALASVVGFGIGSVLTPVFAIELDTKLAVAAVALPHVVGTAQRFLRLRKDVDLALLVRFGLPSAIGGLAGALLQGVMSDSFVTGLFASLLLFVGISEWSGLTTRLQFTGALSYLAGGLSGLLGGLVGNQGGIRSAALLGFDVPKTTFVAVATATALVVDGARLPIYLYQEHDRLIEIWPAILVATAGVIIGTAAGGDLLRRVPDRMFRRIVALTLLGLGSAMLMRAVG
jgi:uncharacterized membrane protein YfcA